MRLREKVFAAFLALYAGLSHADLMLYPTRVVLDESNHAAQLELINTGSDSATYRISLVNRRMSETGEIVPIDTPLPDERFADALLRYSPRQITLAPGAAQIIRLSADLGTALTEGEYRSHLQIDRLPVPSGHTSIETARTVGDKQIGVQLRALIGASIPIIVRHGHTTASVDVKALGLSRHETTGLPLLSLELHRQGNRSVYGDLSVTFTPESGTPQRVGQAGGVAVYTPNPVRRASLLLEPPPGLLLSKGTLSIAYRERSKDGGRLLAESHLALP